MYKEISEDIPAGIYFFKVGNGYTRTRCEIRLKLTTKTSERRQWHRSAIFVVTFEHILQIVDVSIVDCEEVHASLDYKLSSCLKHANVVFSKDLIYLFLLLIMHCTKNEVFH